MDRFKHQHNQIVDLAEGILTAAAANDGDSAGARLTKLRLELSKAVINHVAEEFQEILLHPYSVDTAHAAALSRYHDELLQWRLALVDCNCDWPPNRIFENPKGFRNAFAPILASLKQRIQWEEEHLYPALSNAA